MSNRYYCIDEEEYHAYWIMDISNCQKTKEDFLDEDEEVYDIYAWEDYLDKYGKSLKGEEVVELLEKLHKENFTLKKRIYELTKNTEKINRGE